MIALLLTLLGLAMLVTGGEYMVRGAVSLARHWGLPPFIIGLTIIAYGTSSPELLISANATLSGFSDIALGNVIGSNISNILCVIGLTAIICPVAFSQSNVRGDTIFITSLTLCFAVLCVLGQLDLLVGILFIAILIAYSISLFVRPHDSHEFDEEIASMDAKKDSKVSLYLKLFGGMLCLLAGSEILVNNAVRLAESMGISQAVIGVTIVAFGGSIPELTASVIAAMHRQTEMVIGNVLGSNLFNIVGVIGVSSLIAPIQVSGKFITFDVPFLCCATIVLFLVINFTSRFNRLVGVAFFSLFLAFIWQQFYPFI